VNSLLPSLGLRVDALALAMVLDAEEQLRAVEEGGSEEGGEGAAGGASGAGASGAGGAEAGSSAQRVPTTLVKYVTGNRDIRARAHAASSRH
jgi:hypothetical protein